MFIDVHNLHCQFILKVGTYRGQLENITIIITSTVFVLSYPSNFLRRQNWKYNLERNPCLSKLHEIFNSLCFLVNGLEYLSQAVTPWKCICPRQGCWCHRQEFTSWEKFTVEVEVSDSALRQMNFPFPFTEACNLCNSSGLANREVSVLNVFYSKGSVYLCLSSLIPKSKTVLLQVEYMHRANILKVWCMYSLFSTARTIFLVQKEA